MGSQGPLLRGLRGGDIRAYQLGFETDEPSKIRG